MKKFVDLNRSDFKKGNAEVNYFEDYVLESVGVPEAGRKEIESISLVVTEFSVETYQGDEG